MLITGTETTASFRDDTFVRLKFLLGSGYSSVWISRLIGGRFQGGPLLAKLLQKNGIPLHTSRLGCPLPERTQRCARELAEYASEILQACGYAKDLRGTIAFRRYLRRQAPQGRLDTAMTITNSRHIWLPTLPRTLAWKIVTIAAEAMYLTGTTTIWSLRDRLRVSDHELLGSLKTSRRRSLPHADPSLPAQVTQPVVATAAVPIVTAIAAPATSCLASTIESPAISSDWNDAQAFKLSDLIQSDRSETLSIWICSRSGKSLQNIRRMAETFAQQSGEIPLGEWLEKAKLKANADIGDFRLEDLVTLFQWRESYDKALPFDEKVIGLIDRRRQELCAILPWVEDAAWSIADTISPLAAHGITVELCRDFDLRDLRFGDNGDVFKRLLEDMTKKDLQRWQPPWRTVIPPQFPQRPNRRRYSFWNSFWLALAAQTFGYQTGYWASRKTWARLGAKVKPGERAFPIVGWFRNQFTEERKRELSLGEKEHPGWSYRVYAVFNAAQIEGWAASDNPSTGEQHFERFDKADNFIKRTEAKIKTQSNIAAYYPDNDEIWMPPNTDFESQPPASAEAAFYSTLLHELIHWTGADHRKGRLRKEDYRSGDGVWSIEKEELVAEFGATFLCSQLGITKTPLPNHAPYLDYWFEELKRKSNDPARELLSAAEQALDAIRYLNKLVTEPSNVPPGRPCANRDEEAKVSPTKSV